VEILTYAGAPVAALVISIVTFAVVHRRTSRIAEHEAAIDGELFERIKILEAERTACKEELALLAKKMIVLTKKLNEHGIV
jgi:hypothetical protein